MSMTRDHRVDASRGWKQGRVADEEATNQPALGVGPNLPARVAGTGAWVRTRAGRAHLMCGEDGGAVGPVVKGGQAIQETVECALAGTVSTASPGVPRAVTTVSRRPPGQCAPWPADQREPSRRRDRKCGSRSAAPGPTDADAATIDGRARCRSAARSGECRAISRAIARRPATAMPARSGRDAPAPTRSARPVGRCSERAACVVPRHITSAGPSKRR